MPSSFYKREISKEMKKEKEKREKRKRKKEEDCIQKPRIKINLNKLL